LYLLHGLSDDQTIWLEKQKERSLNVIACLEGDTTKRGRLWVELGKTTTIEEYRRLIDESDVKVCLKERLKETIKKP
jgi:hypothetical protein